MTDRVDREEIRKLYASGSMAPPNFRNASGSGDSPKGFTKPPTMIQLPSNGRNAPGSNPFGSNPNRALTIGNPTSTQTILSGLKKQDKNSSSTNPRVNSSSHYNQPRKSRDSVSSVRRHDEGPPPKRPRLSGSSPFSKPAYESVGTRFLPRKEDRPLLAPEEREIINVSDDEEKAPINGPAMSSAASDEMNIKSEFQRSASTRNGTSKFFQPSVKQKIPAASTSTSLVADGPDTGYLDDKYNVLGGLSEDPIESYEDSKDKPLIPKPSQVNVQKLARAYEAETKLHQHESNIPWIDLRQKHIHKVASRMKPKSGSTTLLQQIRHESMTSSSVPIQQEKLWLPVKEAFINGHYYPDTPKQILQLFMNPDHRLSFKANEDTRANFVLTEDHCKTMEHTKEKPAISIRANDSLASFKFDPSHRHWNQQNYKKLTKHTGKGLVSAEVGNGDVLFDVARRESEAPDRPVPRPAREGLDVREDHDIREDKNIKRGPPRQGNKRKGSDRTPSKSPTIENFKRDNSGDIGTQPPSKRSRRQGSPEASTSGSHNPRRSTRSAPALPTKGPPADPEEVILVYPQGSPGAVNVTNADLARLDPGEFLNDTLIEFGLKLWLKELEESHPELAKQVHIFSSFFYKKLNGKKDIGQAYDTVRKWTSKLDIFDKKYIIVPINEHLHWYLAIIYKPEHVLLPPLASKPIVKTQTRSSVMAQSLDADEDDPNIYGEQDDQTKTSSEAEVERNLNTDFQSSCTIEDEADQDPVLNDPVLDIDDNKSSSGLSYVTDEETGAKSGPLKPALQGHSTSVTPHFPQGHNSRRSSSRMSVDMIVEDSTEEIDNPPPKSSRAIDPSSFYQPSKQVYKGKKNATLDSHIPHNNQAIGSDSTEIADIPKTYVFILDSLGTRHPQAIKKLSEYLKLEAQDKKSLTNINPAQGKAAYVPVQPNFCDCGVYLLHFAKLFMNDPMLYSRNILSQKQKLPNKDRQDTWHDHKVADMREDLANRIRNLSISWKEERANKGKEREGTSDPKIAVPESDDDIDIVETTGMKKQESAANRPRG